MRKFIIDTDTASDDAVALLLAFNAPDVQIEAITVAAGNVPLELAVQNALYTCELCGKNIPVYAGMAKPLLQELQTAQFVHGEDGMGDIGLPLSGRKPSEGHAVQKLIETVNRFPGEITLVTLGPLTNVAMAVLLDPSFASKVKSCVVMGGSSNHIGNVTPTAEYNIWADPEAAKIVFDSGLPLTMVGIDISVQYACLSSEESARLRNIGTPLAHFVVDIQGAVEKFCRSIGYDGYDLPDPITMAIALDPSVATRTQRYYVTVETGGTLSRGQTVVDHAGFTGKTPNVEVVLEASKARFMDMLHAAVNPS